MSNPDRRPKVEYDRSKAEEGLLGPCDWSVDRYREVFDEVVFMKHWWEYTKWQIRTKDLSSNRQNDYLRKKANLSLPR